MSKIPYYVYILQCADASLYTGITTNVLRRFSQHLAGVASRYTRSHGAKKMIYTEWCINKSLALRREAAIKRLSHQAKLQLCASRVELSK